jgi:hypothetical protein
MCTKKVGTTVSGLTLHVFLCDAMLGNISENVSTFQNKFSYQLQANIYQLILQLILTVPATRCTEEK